LILIVGGFLVTSAANCFNEMIEVDLDKLMTRTKDRPMPAGQNDYWTRFSIGSNHGNAGTWLLGKLNIETGLLSVFSILLICICIYSIKAEISNCGFCGSDSRCIASTYRLLQLLAQIG
jgi:protoheme IX farnesyltransferase